MPCKHSPEWGGSALLQGKHEEALCLGEAQIPGVKWCEGPSTLKDGAFCYLSVISSLCSLVWKGSGPWPYQPFGMMRADWRNFAPQMSGTAIVTDPCTWLSVRNGQEILSGIALLNLTQKQNEK